VTQGSHAFFNSGYSFSEDVMSRLGPLSAFALLATLGMSIAGAASAAADDARYPDLRGQWNRNFVPRWTVGEEKAPLTPEYQKVYEANLADMANGGPGNVPYGPAYRKACR
jgi:hypothetical protein